MAIKIHSNNNNSAQSQQMFSFVIRESGCFILDYKIQMKVAGIQFANELLLYAAVRIRDVAHKANSFNQEYDKNVV